MDSAEKLLRKNFVGASEAPIIMGICKFKTNDGRYKTPYLLWQEKLGLIEMDCTNANTEYGNRMESPALMEYEKMTNNIMNPQTAIIHAKIPFMRASLDGLSLDGKIAVEIKNPGFDDHECARRNQVPDHYWPQVQHQLACIGHEMMHYFSFYKGEGLLVEVYRDESYIKRLIEKETKFWDCVKNLKEPELIDKDFRERNGNWVQKSQKLWELEQQIRDLTKESKDLKDELKELSEGLSSRGGGYRFVCSSSKGSVDYDSIPELEDVDLEKYRKEPIERWSLKKEKE